ncbi:hypothetical protein D3C85_839390 [compost metagenome]
MHERAGQGHDLFGQQRGRQFPREFVQAARIGLALDRGLRLQPQSGRQLADQQAHAQQHAEGQQVLHVGHGERRQRLDKEEIEQPHADDRGQRRRPPAMAQRHGHHRQQEEHDDVGLMQRREGERGQRRGGSAIAQGPGIAGQGRRGAFVGGLAGAAAQGERIASGRRLGGQRRRAQTDDVDFGAARGQHVGKAMAAPQPARRHDGVQQGRKRQPQALQAAGARAAHDRLGDVVAAHIAHHRVDHVAASKRFGAGAQ